MESLPKVRTEDQICANTSFGADKVGAACSSCGHTNLVHEVSTVGSETLNHECQLCRLEFLIGKLPGMIQHYEKLMPTADMSIASTPGQESDD